MAASPTLATLTQRFAPLLLTFTFEELKPGAEGIRQSKKNGLGKLSPEARAVKLEELERQHGDGHLEQRRRLLQATLARLPRFRQ